MRTRAIDPVRLEVFHHLHALSLRFHLERQTGGLTRDIERGTRGISSLVSYTLYSILPTLVEISLVIGYLVLHYDVWFAGITGVFPSDLGTHLVNEKTRGERITIGGHVFDGTGEPLRDCIVELWQADADGLYPSPSEMRGAADPNFTGWGRCPADQQTGLGHAIGI